MFSIQRREEGVGGGGHRDLASCSTTKQIHDLNKTQIYDIPLTSPYSTMQQPMQTLSFFFFSFMTLLLFPRKPRELLQRIPSALLKVRGSTM